MLGFYLADLSRCFEPVHDRHREVHKYNSRWGGWGRLEQRAVGVYSLKTVRGTGYRGVPALFHAHLEEAEVDCVVVDDKDAVCGSCVAWIYGCF